jgi:hypothetical protein
MSIPDDRAVPSIIFIADSISFAFKSSILRSAILRISSRVTLPTFILGVEPEPFSIPAAFLRRAEAGGVFSLKVKLRSSNMVIYAGTISPANVFVASLNCLQNS